MAIDWGRMTRGVATGYLGAKIANTEANDALKAKDNTRSTKEIAKLFKISIKKMTLGCKEVNEKM